MCHKIKISTIRNKTITQVSGNYQFTYYYYLLFSPSHKIMSRLAKNISKASSLLSSNTKDSTTTTTTTTTSSPPLQEGEALSSSAKKQMKDKDNMIKDMDDNNKDDDAATADHASTPAPEDKSSSITADDVDNKNKGDNKEAGDDSDDDDDDSDDDADDDKNDEQSSSASDAKRFLPAYKKPNAALTFPEKMMNLMNYASVKVKGDKHFCVSWLPDGKAFVIYDIKEFTNDVIPKFFKASKFCSFTRKLYRWGFRQLNRGIGPDEPIIFGNEFFQSENADLMVNMRSITAASIRKRESNLLRHMLASKKRALLSLNGGNAAAVASAAQTGGHSQTDTNTMKQHERNFLLNNAFGVGQQQKAHQQQLAAAAVVTAGGGGIPPGMSASQRFGVGGGQGLGGGDGNGNGNGNGGITSTELSHMSNHQLQQLYRNCSNTGMPNNVGLSSSDMGTMGPVSDALSQVNSGSGGGGMGGNMHNFTGVMPSCLPQDFSSVLPSLPNSLNHSSFNKPINNYMFDINGEINGMGGGNNNNMNGLGNNMNGLGGLNGLNNLNGLNSLNGLNGLNGGGNQNAHSPFSASFPLNPGNPNMQSADLAMYGHNNMNKQGGNYGFNLQQFNNNNNNVGANNNNNSNYGGNDTMNNNDINMNLNNMNHQHLLNQQFSAATGGSNDVNSAW